MLPATDCKECQKIWRHIEAMDRDVFFAELARRLGSDLSRMLQEDHPDRTSMMWHYLYEMFPEGSVGDTDEIISCDCVRHICLR